MVKSRFSSLDARAMVNSVRPSIVGCKLTNIYDLNSRVYILKLARKDFKCFLMLESGVRFHLTGYSRDKSAIPSNYTMKLRKHIRTRRLTGIEQVGCDRIVDITFGHGETAFHLILELYVSGNLLLTDHEYRILALLRSHSDEHSKVALRELYPVASAIGLLTVPVDEFPRFIDEMLNLASQRQENQELKELEVDDEKAKTAGKKTESAFAKRSKKRVSHSAMPLVTLLHKLAPFADPALCANSVASAMAAAGLECANPFKLTVDDFAFEDVVELLQRAVEVALETLRSVSRPCDVGGGSMPVLEDRPEEEPEEEDDAEEDAPPAESAPKPKPQEAVGPKVPGWVIRRRVHVPPTEPYWANDEFTPLPPKEATMAQPEAVVSYPTFHQCVDEFYTLLEEHKAVEQKAQHAKTVFDKVERIRADQGRRVEQLEAEQTASERQARLIEANVELVERALAMVNAMLASQIDWGDLWREVKRQQRLGHPIAQHIHALDLERSEMQFLLSGLEDDQDPDGEEDRPMEVVPLDLNLTPHANVARLHSRRKETRDKTSRTMVNAETAIKQAERKAQLDLQKFQLKQTIRRVRQTWWFEKFFWFVSSENYVVVAGHDAQQTEQIFSRHVGPKDVFVQADVAGARTVFIRNPSGGEVPPATLREAGTMTLCHSSAWDKRIVISAWWVPVAQVTRGGPAAEGDFVLVDGFVVRGRRHFMPPVHLEMGLTLLFHLGDGSAARHRGERRSRYLEAMGGGNEAEAEESGSDDGSEVEVGAGEGSDEEGGEREGGEDEPSRGEEAEDAVEEQRRVEEAKEEPEEAKEEPEEAKEEDQEEEEAGEDADAAGGDECGREEAAGSAVSGGERQEPAESEAAAEEEAGTVARGARAKMSRAERRKAKKGGAEGSDSGAGAAEGAGFDPPRRQNPPKAPAAAKAPQPVAKPLPRGQKTKAKKIRERYAEQDEEERQLRMALLGSKETKRLAAEKAPQATAAPTSEQAAPPADAPAADAPAANAPAAEAPAAEAATAEAATAEGGGGDGAKGGRGGGRGGKGGGKGGGRGGKSEQSRREEARLLTAGCEAEEGGPSFSQFAQLDLLTGQPHPEDEVLYAMAMVAPYCSLGGPYTFRAKLTPGPGKKGQVAKQCLKMFEAQIDKQAWKLLVQAIPENDTASLMMGSCKASMPGMQKLQQQVVKDKKKEKKERDVAPGRK